MTCRFLKASAASLVVVLAVAAIGTVAAQGPGGPRRGGPGRRMGPPRMATAIGVPLPQLDKALTLTEDQRTQIETIRAEFDKAMRELRPQRPQPGGAPPDPSTMKASMDKMDQLDKTYSDRVVALLTASQKTALKVLLQDLNDFRVVGIPPDATAMLKLSEDQRTGIHAIAIKAEAATKALVGTGVPKPGPDANRETIDKIHRDAHDAALALLTDDQKTTLDNMPRQGPGGGRGGPGGPPPGGPEGGQMGPPPGPDGGPDGGPQGPPPNGMDS